MVKQNFLTKMLLLCALIVGSVSSAWGQSEVTIWEEDWSSGQANDQPSSITNDKATYAQSSSSTKLYAEALAEGESPELLIAKGTTSTFTATIDLGGRSGVLNLTFKTNGANLALTTTTTDVTISGTMAKGNNSFTISVPSGKETLVLVFTSTTSNKNTRIDDFKLTATTSNSYTVTYNSNGATSGTVPTDENTYSASSNTVTVLGNIGNLAKTGYTFGGWNTKADGTGTNYTAGSTFTISASTILYAKWNANTHTVNLPTNDSFGNYTMSATNPVAYGTEVTLTYTPADGYENYAATWSVNDEPIAKNKFTMPDEDVTVTVSVEKVTTVDMTIDFENVVSNYTDWSFTNMTSKETGNANISGHNNSTYYGTTGGKETASITTNSTIANPQSLTCYVSKQSNNTTSSTWYIQVKGKNDTDWTNVNTQSATNMSAGTWVEFTADLSNYSDVYVRVYYSGSTAIRNIDDLTLTYEIDQNVASITTNPTSLNLDAESHNGSIVVTYTNITSGQSVVLCDAEGAAASYDWITATVDATTHNVNYSINANNSGAARTAYLKVHGVDGENTDIYSNLVTINQAKLVVNVNYTQTSEFVPGRHYIIVGCHNNAYKAMGAQDEKNRAAVGITVNEGTTTIASDAGVSEVLLGVDESGFFTFYDEGNNGYLYASCGEGTSNTMNVQSTLDDYGRWTISTDDNGALIILAQAGAKNQLQYNNGNSIFSCYSATQKNVYLYERDGDTGSQEFTVNIAAACTDGEGKYYGTFSAPFAFTAPEGVTVSEIGINSGKLAVSEYAEGAVIPANTGVMISSANAGAKTFTSAKGGTSVLDTYNCMHASNYGITAEDMEDAAPSCKYYRLTMHNGTQIGFWWGAAEGAAFALAANKAYLAVPSTTGAPSMGLWIDDDTTGIQSIERTVTDNQYYTLDGRRVAEPTKGLYIVNGKKVVIK